VLFIQSAVNEANERFGRDLKFRGTFMRLLNEFG
jgi:hypothetical protein